MTLCTGACLCNPNPDCTVQITQEGVLSAGFLDAFSTTGGDPVSATQNLSGYFFLTNGWRVRPAEKNSSYLVEGNLFTCGGACHPFVNTVGAFNTFVAINTSAQSLTSTTSTISCVGLGQIADAVWDEPTAGHTTAGSFGKLMGKLKTILTILFTK